MIATSKGNGQNGRSLPEGWEWKTIGDVTLPIEKVDPTQKSDKEFIYLDIASIDNSVHRITEPKSYYGADAPSRARQLVHAHDVLFSTVRTYLEKIAEVPAAYDGQIASTGFAVLRANEYVLAKYLFYYSLTQEFLEPLNELQRGTSYPAVRDGDVRAQPIPIPPLPEQGRIVSRIEELFSDLDAGMAALERVRTGLKRYNASVLKAAVEGRIVNGNSGVEQGGLPEGWWRATIEEISDKNRLPTYGILKPGKYLENGIPMLRILDIKRGNVDLSNVHRVPESLSIEYKRTILRGGECLISLVGTIGESVYVPETAKGANVHRNLGVIVPNESVIDGRYLNICLRSEPIQSQIRDATTGANQPLFNIRDLKRIRISLPPIKEQRRIIAEVDRRLSVAQEVESAVEASLVRGGRLRQSVLKSAFEGIL